MTIRPSQRPPTAAELEKLLRLVEWAPDDSILRCSVCGGWKEHGHEPGCAMAAMIARLDAAKARPRLLGSRLDVAYLAAERPTALFQYHLQKRPEVYQLTGRRELGSMNNVMYQARHIATYERGNLVMLSPETGGTLFFNGNKRVKIVGEGTAP